MGGKASVPGVSLGLGACWGYLTGARVALPASTEKGFSSNCLVLVIGYWEASQVEKYNSDLPVYVRLTMGKEAP